MHEKDLDPLRELFRSFPELEPPQSLKYKILNGIETKERASEVWFLKPGLALASFLLVALLGFALAIKMLPQESGLKQKSPLMQWAHSNTQSFSLAKGGFSV